VTLAAAPGKPDAFSKKFSIIGTMLMEFEMQTPLPHEEAPGRFLSLACFKVLGLIGAPTTESSFL
jgi:hypothetical protein